MPPPKRIPPGQAIQVVSLLGVGGATAAGTKSRKRRALKLDTVAFKDITSKTMDYPIAVISIAGPARGGKSFILSYIVRYLTALEKASQDGSSDPGDWMEKDQPKISMKDKGFKFQNGTDRTTDGIWMWSKPFIINRNGSRIAVLLIDTEGCFDPYSSEAEQSAIVGLALLTSSCFIFNESKNINENTLTTLARFMQYGQLAAQEFDKKCFQRIMFLVRDWNFPNKHEYGAAGGSAFISEHLKSKSTMSEEAVQNRDLMQACFEDFNCYLMPFPGEDVLSEDFTGSISEMKVEFMNHIEHFTTSLIANAALKHIATMDAHGDSLYELFAGYVDAFNSDDMPSPISILKATMFSAYEAHITSLAKGYREAVQKKIQKQPYVLTEALQKVHTKQKMETMEKFAKLKTFSDPYAKQSYNQKLDEKVDKIYGSLSTELQNRQRLIVENAEKIGLQEYQSFLQSNLGSALCTPQEFQVMAAQAEKSALAEFLKTLGTPTESFFNFHGKEFALKLSQSKNLIWKDIEERRQGVMDNIQAILDGLIQDYVDSMDVLLGEEYKQTKSLEKAHQKYLAKALFTFHKVNEKEHKFPQEFVHQAETQLKDSIGSEFEKIEQANEQKLQDMESKMDDIIREAVEAYDEQVAPILEDMRTAHPDHLQEVYKEVVDVSLQCMEDEDIPDIKLLKTYQKKLSNALKEAHTSAVQMVLSSQEKKKFDCEKILEEAHRALCSQLTTFLTTEPYHEVHVLEQEIQKLAILSKTNFESRIKEFNLPDDASVGFLRRFDEHVVTEGDSLRRENEARKSQSEMEMDSAVRNAKLKYSQSIQMHEESCMNLDEIKGIHDRLADEAVASLDPSNTGNAAPPAAALRQYQNDLRQELNDLFSTTRRSVQIRIEERDRNIEDAMETATQEYESSLNRLVTTNPFLSERDVEYQHDKEVKVQVAEFKSKVRNDLHNNAGKLSEVVGQLKNMLKVKKVLMLEAAERSKQEAEQSIQLLHDDCWTSFEESMTSLSTQHGLTRPKLENRCQQLMEDTENLFDDRWNLPLGEQKTKALKDLKKRMRQKITQICDDQKATMDRAERVITDIMRSFATDIEKEVQEGKCFDGESLRAQLTNEKATLSKKLQKKLKEQNLTGAGLINLDNIQKTMDEKYARLQQQNDNNWQKVKTEINKILKTTLEAKKDSITNKSQLTNLETELKNKVTRYASGVCDLEANLEAKSYLEKSTKGVFEDFVDDLKTMSEANTSDILKLVMDSYSAEITKLLPPGGASVHPDTLTSFHNRCLDRCIQEAEDKYLGMSDRQKSLVRDRLANSLRIAMEKNNRNAASAGNLAIGIDLGTTTSCVAIFQNNAARVIKDINGDSLTPSYVHFPSTGQPPTVGVAAKQQAEYEPESVVFDAKRLIGRPFNDHHVQEDMKTWPFTVENDGSNKPALVVREKKYTPEEISAQVLIHMKKIAEEHLKQKVTKAVITVPANFNDGQRDATRQAAQVAGLEVLQIINEPTSAAMAHAVTWKDEERIVLVFDFGGGTFDVSVLKTGEFNKGTTAGASGSIAPKSKSVGTGTSTNSGLQVLSTLGDMHLGGEDFDSNMVNFCANEFETMNGIKLLEKSTRPEDWDALNGPIAVNRRLRRLRNACEQVKRTLTVADVGTISLDAIHGGIDIKVTISRAQFEKMNEHLFKKSIDIVQKALEDAQVDKAFVNDVIMVGGSSRIPRVRELLASYLGLPTVHLDQDIDIQEAVALGAAVQACILNGGELASKLPRIQDVQPFTLGIEVVGAKMSPIIKKNSPIPIEATESYQTTKENQREANIVIYSGEDKKVAKNYQLGEFKLTGIPKGAAGSQELTVTMKIDESGILNVTATCKSTGSSQNLVIEESRGRLSERQVHEMRARAGVR